jgi:hypothetical protein
VRGCGTSGIGARVDGAVKIGVISAPEGAVGRAALKEAEAACFELGGWSLVRSHGGWSDE